MREALAAGALSRAARLRWKLFLQRSGRPAHLTPLEYVSGTAGRGEGARALREATWQVYLLMFAVGEGQRRLFEQMDHTLTRVEGGAAGDA